MKDRWDKKFINEIIERMDEKIYRSYFIGEFPPLKDGEPCSEKGCLNHKTHPCECCGRIAGNTEMTRAYYERQKY